MSNSLFQSTKVFAGMTFISRLLGFARDMILAQLFGATAGFDAFLVAFKIPNFMRRLFAEGAFSQAFIPVLAEYRQQRSPEAVQEFVNKMAGTLALVLIVVTIIGVIFAPILVLVFASGLILHDPLRFSLASVMLRITFPYILLVSLTAFIGSVLNCFGRFAVAAFTPALLNIAMMVMALWFAKDFTQPIYAVAWGVVIGGILQLAFQLPSLKRIHLLHWPRLDFRDSGVKKVLKLMVPALFGVSVGQIGLLVDTIFASYLPVGSISWLYYSERLAYFPLGIFAVAIATVILPHLSRQHAANAPADFSKSLDWGLRLVLFIAIPATIGLMLLAKPLLATLFHYRSFNDYDVLMSAKSLTAYGFGLPAFMLVKVLVSGFYSKQNIKTPVKIAAVALIANIALNFILIFPLQQAGLALATSLAAWLNSILLLIFLFKNKIYQANPGWGKYFCQLLIASLLMLAFLYWQNPDFQIWANWGAWGRSYHLAYLILVAGVIYFVGLKITGLNFKKTFRH